MRCPIPPHPQSLLKLDPAELGITIGRLETQEKIERMLKVCRHKRNTDLSTFLVNIKSKLKILRPARNAVTHGAYIGKARLGEFCFRLPAEFVIDDNEQTAHGMFVVTATELQQHIMDITKIAISLTTKFGIPEVHKLVDMPARVRPK